MRNCKENFSKKKKKKFKEKGPLFAVYASLRFAERCLFWENLIAVSGLHSLPWVIVGDFNEVLMGEDKFGGRSVNINRALIFQECLDTCRMIDIGYSGAWFTWSNHHPINHLIQERIDRVFINAEWNFLYPDASVQHLKRAHSDHCPVLLGLDKNHDVKLSQPFRFQPIWLSHPTFPSIVREAWSGPIGLSSAIANFADKAKIWNKNIFGNLFQWKKRLLARLLGIQVAISIRPNSFLLELERQLRSKFHDISKIEEGFGPMKS